jgi:hypothetical protein
MAYFEVHQTKVMHDEPEIRVRGSPLSEASCILQHSTSIWHTERPML